jgi:Ti-type conjugative transfer relaxase TraA
LAIAFARIQFVKRSAGQNACHKAAYNGRTSITNERTGESYNYANKGDGAYHAVLLPEGVDERFKDPRLLWNVAEKRETRINSQVALEGVIALPDDACITMEDRIEIAHRAAHHFFVRHGLAVQIDIHEPHDDEDHNWHAHFLATTRTFTVGGQALGDKAREYMARYREGNLHSGEEYRKIQNDYFAEKGVDLRVDENGIIPQAHLGPVRLRARATEMMQSHLERVTANQNASRNPDQILEHLTERNSVFTRDDVERYVRKHVPANEAKAVREAFWRQKELIQLYEKNLALVGDLPKKEEMHEIAKAKGQYTTVSIKMEEDRILRIADRLQMKDGFFGLMSNYSKGTEIAHKYSLSAEQLTAFEGMVLGQRLVCVQGRAGTGKSHVMSAVREMVESNGYRVRGIAPSSSVAKDLEGKGFNGAQNLHQFLFQQKNGIDPLGRKEILMVDEAGMIGNTVMQELLKAAWDKGSQVILVGDDRQIPSVDRGGLFKVLCERYGAHELREVRRQEQSWQKAMSETLSQGVSSEGVKAVLNTLERQDRLHWSDTKEAAMHQLVDQWALDTERKPEASTFVMEHRNRYALVLNELIRNVRKERCELNGREYRCETFIGTCYVSAGDRIQFRMNDRDLGVNNGTLGTLIETKDTYFVVKTDEGREVTFNPNTFNRYQLGYAGTYHQSQGKTVDQAYALHSPYMNHNLLYVGITRQKREVHYYVSRDEAKDPEALVHQLSRDGSKETTVHYLTPQELMKQQGRSIFTKAVHYVKDKLYQNHDFYRVKDRAVNDETFRGYTVKPVSAYTAMIAERGDTSISTTSFNTVRPKQKDMSNVSLREAERQRAMEGRVELDRMVETLKSRMPEVCQALFPDKPTQMRGHEWRYGSKGSFKVNVSGPKQGGYANFETGDKGGPLHLICEAKQCSMKDAIGWAKEFLNVNRQERVSDRGATGTSIITRPIEPVSTWTSHIPTPEQPAPQLGEGCLSKLAYHNRETARYTYTDAQGNTLFHVVRLESKDQTKSGKMTLPLSYGVPTTDSLDAHGNQPCWSLKRYHSDTSNGLPLYNLKALVEEVSKPVLIVEGEKAAEAAKMILPEMVVTTWHGGAGNVHAADLSSLKGRNVVMWPDNDEAGKKAMETLAQRCKETGVKSIQMVGLEFGDNAPKLPEKWDLADALPQGITQDMVRQKLTDLDLPVITAPLAAERQTIVRYMEMQGFSPELMENFHRHFKLYPKDAVEFFKERHHDWSGSSTIAHTKEVASPKDPGLQKILEADKFIRIHERHIINCQKLGDERSERRFKETLEAYKSELYLDKSLWDRIDTLEKGVCDRLKSLKPEALDAQQLQARKELSRGFER